MERLSLQELTKSIKHNSQCKIPKNGGNIIIDKGNSIDEHMISFENVLNNLVQLKILSHYVRENEAVRSKNRKFVLHQKTPEEPKDFKFSISFDIRDIVKQNMSNLFNKKIKKTSVDEADVEELNTNKIKELFKNQIQETLAYFSKNLEVLGDISSLTYKNSRSVKLNINVCLIYDTIRDIQKTQHYRSHEEEDDKTLFGIETHKKPWFFNNVNKELLFELNIVTNDKLSNISLIIEPCEGSKTSNEIGDENTLTRGDVNKKEDDVLVKHKDIDDERKKNTVSLYRTIHFPAGTIIHFADFLQICNTLKDNLKNVIFYEIQPLIEIRKNDTFFDEPSENDEIDDNDADEPTNNESHFKKLVKNVCVYLKNLFFWFLYAFISHCALMRDSNCFSRDVIRLYNVIALKDEMAGAHHMGSQLFLKTKYNNEYWNTIMEKYILEYTPTLYLNYNVFLRNRIKPENYSSNDAYDEKSNDFFHVRIINNFYKNTLISSHFENSVKYYPQGTFLWEDIKNMCTLCRGSYMSFPYFIFSYNILFFIVRYIILGYVDDRKQFTFDPYNTLAVALWITYFLQVYYGFNFLNLHVLVIRDFENPLCFKKMRFIGFANALFATINPFLFCVSYIYMVFYRIFFSSVKIIKTWSCSTMAVRLFTFYYCCCCCCCHRKKGKNNKYKNKKIN